MPSNDASSPSEPVSNDKPCDEAVREALERIARDRIVERIWNRDPAIWKAELEHQKVISNSLGWLTVVETMLGRVDELTEFAAEIRNAGFKHVALLGMGGSSLCPEVFRRSFGIVEGHPELLVLDSTVPAAVLSLERRIDPNKTLFIVSSKSGKTTEPQVFFEYFFDRVAKTNDAKPGDNFIAITDPGTLLERIAKEKGFRRVFTNPADIGGRYSALSYFGIVPAAVAGYDVKEILERAALAMKSCQGAAGNPGVELGAALGAYALKGRNKLTLVIPEPVDKLADSPRSLASLGLWIEQLIAESTGKEGIGILPVAGEQLGSAEVYGSDRVFVNAGENAQMGSGAESALRALSASGHPVVQRTVNDPLGLGREFFIWEFATAIAGALLGINPFDQPNVQESKDNTERLLAEYEKAGRFSSQEPCAKNDDVSVYCGERTKSLVGPSSTPASILTSHLASVVAGDYLALTAYVEETPEHELLLQQIRLLIRDSRKVATTVGYGPRFLHSTGQLHKGGPATGVFIQITSDDTEDTEIPGRPYSFGRLKEAQSLGDFESLSKRNLRVIRIHLDADVKAGLGRLLKLVRTAL